MTISRVAATLSYPARVTLVCSMNPCPCGYAGDRRRVCRCTPGQIALSGPHLRSLLDRMDLFVDVPRLTRQELREERHSEESRFVRAGSVRREGSRTCARDLPTPHSPDAGCARRVPWAAMRRRSSRGRWTGWGSRGGGDGVLRVARTVADLSGEDETAAHVAEALNYRRSHLVGR